MNRFLITLVATAGIALSTGCATKNYVRKEMAPTVNKVNELDEMTRKNSNDIRDLDARATKGIADVNAKSAEADQKAQVAGQKAGEAQTLASQAAGKADMLGNVVANLDNYHPVAEASIHFGFNQDKLTKKAKTALDEFAKEIPNAKSYIVELTGGTDSVGDKAYNYELSQRRARAVVQYLAQNYDVPAHKIYVIGIGEDKEVAKNSSASGRAQNRRVDLRLMTNAVGTDAPTQASNVQPQQ